MTDEQLGEFSDTTHERLSLLYALAQEEPAGGEFLESGGNMKLRADDLTWREIDGELVVLDLRSSKYLTTNPSATFLMKQLAVEKSAAELADALMNQFAISRTDAERDVHVFVDDLDRRGLLVHS